MLSSVWFLVSGPCLCFSPISYLPPRSNYVRQASSSSLLALTGALYAIVCPYWSKHPLFEILNMYASISFLNENLMQIDADWFWLMLTFMFLIWLKCCCCSAKKSNKFCHWDACWCRILKKQLSNLQNICVQAKTSKRVHYKIVDLSQSWLTSAQNFCNIFVHFSKCICPNCKIDFCKMLSLCPNCKMYLSKLQNVSVQIAKFICPNCKMYLSKLPNVFVQSVFA